MLSFHLTVAGAVLACSCAGFAQQVAPTNPFPAALDLFHVREGVQDPFFGRVAKIKRSQPVFVDLLLFRQAIKGDVFRLQMLDEVFFARCVEKRAIPAEADAFHWFCKLEGVKDSHVVLTVVRDGFAAWVYDGPRATSLVVQGAPGMHCVRAIDDGGKTCGCDANHVVPGAVGGPQAACDDSTARISVLMVYDGSSRSQAGGDTKIKAACANGLAQASVVLRNSMSSSQFVATSIRYANYDANVAMATELYRITYRAGHSKDPAGYLDWVHATRKTEAADMVTFIVGNDSAHGNILGIAWRPSGQPTLDYTFSVTEWNSAANYTLAHEMGHNFGCAHDAAHSGSNVIYPYAYGYVKNYYNFWPDKRFFRSVMSYQPSCPFGWICSQSVAPLFSNPYVTIVTSKGKFPGGDAATAYNAKTISETRQSIANHSWTLRGYRSSPVITSQPRSRSVCLGYLPANTVLFSVAATGVTAYQWQKNGVNMSGKTAPTLSLSTNISNADGALYRCVVRGPCYSRTSASARLTIDNSCRTGVLRNTHSGSGFGDPVVALGDWNGDGYRDFAIGQPRATIATLAAAGAVEIRSGKDHARLGGGMVGNQASLLLGASLAAGDLDGDGRLDLIAGARGYNSNDGAVFWSSSKDQVMRRFKSGKLGFGAQVGCAQYLDLDGVHDVLASAGSTLFAYSGASGAELWKVSAGAVIHRIAVLGDVNRDGYDDVALGIPSYNGNRGRIEVRSGVNGSLLRVTNGTLAGAQLGHGLAALAGDITGDRIPDYVTGSPGHSSSRGVMSFWDGGNGGWLGDVAGSASGQRFGWAVAAGGDYNGDGVVDALATAYPLSTAVKGSARLISGADRTTVLRTMNGPSQTFGYAAAVLDTNGDSKLDAIVSEPAAQVVWVFDGGPKANPPAQRSYGTICADSMGRLPRGSHSPDPRINSTTTLFLDSAPPNTPVFIQAGSLRPALSLGSINMPGCYWHIVPIVDALVTTDGLGRVALPAAVANSASLVGVTLAVQWFPIDFGLPSSVLQVVASNGSMLKIGAR